MLDSTNFQATDRLLKLDIYLVGKVEISPGSYLMALHLSYRQTAHISTVTIVTSFFIPDRTGIEANDRSLKLNLSSVGDLEYSHSCQMAPRLSYRQTAGARHMSPG
jgi:hypothetical protein